MAKLKALPAKNIISKFKHSIDYYVHKGVVCARRWPRPPSGPRSPAVQHTAAEFGDVAQRSGNPAPLIKLYAEMIATWEPRTWRDIVESAYYGNVVEVEE